MNLHFVRKLFGQIFVLKFCTKFYTKTHKVNLFEYYGQKSCLKGISKPQIAIITNLNLTKLGFVRKLRPKLIHRIGSS
jgi:hypothetical protein